MKTSELFDLSRTLAEPLLRVCEYPWEALDDIAAFIRTVGPTLGSDFERRGEEIWVACDAIVAPTAFIGGPCIIDHGAEVRHGAYIREKAIVGKGAVVGNSTELKNAILFDRAQAPHYNYVGDSILGYHAHLGAGAITSNLKSDESNIVVHADPPLATGRRKLGAILGDEAEIGCQCVLNPGTVIGRGARVYPLSSVRGVVPARHIYKSRDEIVPIR